MEVHHIGYLVKNIDKSIESFQKLGYEIAIPATWDAGRNAYLCFMRNGGYCVELIAPAKDSSLYPLLKQYNNAPYHICYKCEHLEDAVAILKTEKFMPFLEPAPASVIGKTARVAFLISARAGMIELVEE